MPIGLRESAACGFVQNSSVFSWNLNGTEYSRKMLNICMRVWFRCTGKKWENIQPQRRNCWKHLLATKYVTFTSLKQEDSFAETVDHWGVVHAGNYDCQIWSVSMWANNTFPQTVVTKPCLKPGYIQDNVTAGLQLKVRNSFPHLQTIFNPLHWWRK